MKKIELNFGMSLFTVKGETELGISWVLEKHLS